MPKDRETEYSEDEFSLDAILAEFGSGKTEEARRRRLLPKWKRRSIWKPGATPSRWTG